MTKYWVRVATKKGMVCWDSLCPDDSNSPLKEEDATTYGCPRVTYASEDDAHHRGQDILDRENYDTYDVIPIPEKN